MRTSEADLFSQWDLLQEQVIPHLTEGSAGRRSLSVWAKDDVADAVAFAVAYRQAPGRTRPPVLLEAFAGEASASPVGSYSMCRLRSIPVAARRESFCRSSHGWVPAPSVAERVILGEPGYPVDLIVVRPARRPAPRGGYACCLRPGGYLLTLGEPPESLGADVALEPVPGSPLLRKVREDDGCPPIHGGPSDGPEPCTLARRMLEEDLVARHLNLARALARRFSGHGEPVDDLRQVAFMGLVLAARRYDPAQNASFSTYATATVLGELKRYFRDKSWMMRVPRQVQEAYLAIKTAREELYQELACSPTIAQIARRLGTTEEAVLEAMEAGDNFLPQSLDAGLEEDSAGRDVPVIDGAFEVMLDRNVLLEAIPRLSSREQLVLKRVHLDGWTQRRVAQEIGVSQMQVSRLLHASAQKIRSWTGT